MKIIYGWKELQLFDKKDKTAFRKEIVFWQSKDKVKCRNCKLRKPDNIIYRN